MKPFRKPENVLTTKPATREYVPETPERERRSDAIEELRDDLRQVQQGQPTFQLEQPNRDAFGNIIPTGWTEEDMMVEEGTPTVEEEGYIEPNIFNPLRETYTAEPAAISWYARATSEEIKVPEQDFLDRYLFTPPVLRPIPRRPYHESPFAATPGTRENPIVIPDTPKGTEDDPIVID